MEPYQGRNAVVTGAASGIGEALAKALAQRGVHVVVADIDTDGAQRVASEIADAGGRGEAVALDVRDAGQVSSLVERVVSERGTLDYMFNNAGIAILAEALRMDLDDWNRIIDVNLRGVVHGIHAAYPVMARQGRGHIVNTASIAGLMPAAVLSGYVATKHAVVGLSNSLRIEAERHGVAVSVVCPGVIDTPIHDNAEIRGFHRETVQQNIPFSGYSPAACARDVLHGVARNQGMIVVTRHGKALTTLHRYAPRLFDRLMRRQVRKGLATAATGTTE